MEKIENYLKQQLNMTKQSIIAKKKNRTIYRSVCVKKPSTF